MPFDPIDFYRQEPPERPDPFASTGGQELAVLIGAALAVGVLLFLVLFPLPLILAIEAYDALHALLIQP